jgi:hypothetical protein
VPGRRINRWGGLRIMMSQMFHSPARFRSRFSLVGPKRLLAAAGVAVLVGAGAGGIISAAGDDIDSTTFPAQVSLWDRAADGEGSRYSLQEPLVGMHDDFRQPVYYAVVAWQQLLNASGAQVVVDGAYGPATAAAVKNFQAANDIEPTGVVGYPTAKALLQPMVNQYAASAGIPPKTLMCHIATESNLDPGAVGLNGADMGIAQISLPHNPGVTAEDAFDIDFAIKYMAERNANAYNTYGNWSYAVASYNSPVAANQWQASGTGSERITTYAERALGSC